MENKSLLGRTVITSTNEEYVFVYDPQNTNTPYYQIDLNNYEVADMYPEALFSLIKAGFKLEVGGEVVAILY